MKQPVLSLVGFVMFAIGILSVILSMVGLKFTFLSFIYNQGVITLLIQLILLFGGMILLYVARTSESLEE